MKQEKKPFIPKDKPKSWVIGILSGLVGLLIAGPILFTGAHYEINSVKVIGQFLFTCCWVLFAASWLLFVVGLSSGKYKNIQSKKWNDQLW